MICKAGFFVFGLVQSFFALLSFCEGLAKEFLFELQKG
jgi:hypothetical protein